MSLPSSGRPESIYQVCICAYLQYERHRMKLQNAKVTDRMSCVYSAHNCTYSHVLAHKHAAITGSTNCQVTAGHPLTEHCAKSQPIRD